MISRYFYCTVSLLIFCCLVRPVQGFGQKDTIRREVEVVKAYTPTVKDAEKINETPVIKEEVQKKPRFDYSIDSKPVFSTLPVKDLQAATIVGKPAEVPGYGLVRAGAGNYYRPYAEIYFNNPKGKNSIFGLYGRHLSSFGKLNLPTGDRVKTPFSENEAEMFMKYMVGKSTLSVNLGIDHNGFRYYGYPGTDSIPVFLKTIPAGSARYTYQGNRQTFTKGGISINLKNIYASKSDPSTGFEFQYYRFGTRTGQREDYAKFEMNLRRPQEVFSFMADAGVEYSNVTDIYAKYQEVLPVLTHRGQTWFYFKPAIYLGNETVNLKLGFKTWLVAGLVDKAQFKIAPDIRFNFTPVKEIINVFAGADGNYFHNHYYAIAYQNPYVTPTLIVNNHLEKYRLYGGFDGKISSRTNFKIQIDYSGFSQHPFYYLQGFLYPPLGQQHSQRPYIDNTFKVMYDDMKMLKFNGELTYYMGNKFNLLFSANIYKYTMSVQPKAWNLPRFDVNVSMNYTVTDRFTVSGNLYVTGEREALVLQTNSDWNPSINWDFFSRYIAFQSHTYTLKPAIDLNVRGNYDITRKLAVFAMLNNLGFQQYQRWLGYPVQSFNFLGGISFSF